MLEAGCRHEGRPRSPPLQKSVRRDRRAVREAVDAVDSESRGGCDDRLLLVGRGGDLRGPHLTVGDDDGVREGAADVDSQRAHGVILNESR